MDLLQLTYFKKVAECENMTMAAKEMMVTPSSLCASIRRLEADLDCRLFDRIGRNIKLNENGTVVLQHTNVILSSIEIMRKELVQHNSKNKQLIIGTANRTYWIEAINQYALQHPDINISCTTLTCADLADPYLHVQYDFVFSAAADFNQPDWNSDILIKNDTPMLLVNKDHPLAGKSSIDLRDVANEPFIAFDKKNPSRQFFDSLFEQAGIKPNVVINCDQLLRAPLITSGYGIGVTTKYGAKTQLLSQLVAIPITYPPYKREQAMYHYKLRPHSEIEAGFRTFILDFFKNI